MASSAGTCTIVEENFGSVKRVKWSFVSGSGASVNSITTPTTTNAYNGEVLMLYTKGGAGGLAPSASWDITIVDGSNVDILAGQGANRAAAGEYTLASMGGVANDTLTLTIASTGSSNAADVYLFIR